MCGASINVFFTHFCLFSPYLALSCHFAVDWSFSAVFFHDVVSGEGLAFLPGVPVVGGLGFPARG